MLFRSRRSHLKYEFHVRPGIDFSQIVIRYEGSEGLSIDGEGTLHIQTPMGELVDNAPFVYQTINGKKIELTSHYRLIDKGTYTFEIIGQIDPNAELIIDPDLSWGSYLGGSDDDAGCSVTVDLSGNVFLIGYTESTNFPTPGGFDTTINGSSDVFLAKFTNSGQIGRASCRERV